jgi:hypothetical protein
MLSHEAPYLAEMPGFFRESKLVVTRFVRVRGSRFCVLAKQRSAFRIPYVGRMGALLISAVFQLRLKTAEMPGFEPGRALRPYLVSSEALSTTQPRLLGFDFTIFKIFFQR